MKKNCTKKIRYDHDVDSVNPVLSLFFILAPFAVSGAYTSLVPFAPTSVVTQAIVALYFIFVFAKGHSIIINRLEQKIIAFFFVPVIASMISMAYTYIFTYSKEYSIFFSENLIDRLILITFNFLIIIGLLSITAGWSKVQSYRLIKMYYYGLLVIAIIGFWQFLHYVINIPYLAIETRNRVHGVQNAATLFSNRVTSIASEPSYLAPLLLDLILLSFIVCKKALLSAGFGLFVLIFTFSAGGYINLVVLCFAFVLGFSKYKKCMIPVKALLTITTISFITVLIIFNNGNNVIDLLQPVIGRTRTIFNINEQARVFMSVMPFYWVLEGNMIVAALGYGPNSYKYLGMVKNLPSGNPVHVTSNNLFADTVFELGYFGFISYVMVFVQLLIRTWKKMTGNRVIFISFLLTVHLLISSAYRADYMQPRFWIIMFIVMKTLSIEGGIDERT